LAAGDWDGDGRAELVVTSTKEQAVGLARFNAEGRLDYPQPLPSIGRPIAVAAGDLAGTKTLTVLVLREEKGKRWVDFITRNPAGEPVITRTLELTGLKTDPRGLRLVDANQDGLLDVAVFTPLDSLRLFMQTKDGSFADASATAGFRKGLVDNLDASALNTGDVTGDGKVELLVSAGGFARALRVDAAGALTVWWISSTPATARRKSRRRGPCLRVRENIPRWCCTTVKASSFNACGRTHAGCMRWSTPCQLAASMW
jgi:hypothetical protein